MTFLAHEQPPRALAPGWFMPLLVLFTVTYMITGFLGIIRSLPGKIHRFELALPTINVAWTFVLAEYVGTAMGGSKIAIGIIGVIVGAGHLAASRWLADRDREGARGTNAFIFAGIVLLALALPATMDSTLLSLPLLAVLAFGAARMSEKWHSGSIRLTSYLLQIYANGALAVLLLSQETSAAFLASTLSAGGLACTGLFHYRWCRSHKPPEESSFFSRIDKADYSVVAVLLMALLSAFFMLRVIAVQILTITLVPADLANALRCSQSVIINLSAVVLMFFALAHRNREVRNVAILVTVIGAIRVFLYDLIGASGMPLVISVLSFGLATAVESVILGRWQHLVPAAQEPPPGAEARKE
jgi:MFS family permease